MSSSAPFFDTIDPTTEPLTGGVRREYYSKQSSGKMSEAFAKVLKGRSQTF